MQFFFNTTIAKGYDNPENIFVRKDVPLSEVCDQSLLNEVP
jgi:hypothetical protein